VFEAAFITVSATLFEAPGRPASANAALNSRLVKVPQSAASNPFNSNSNLLGPSVFTNARICSHVNAAASSGLKPPSPTARTFSVRGEFAEVDIEVTNFYGNERQDKRSEFCKMRKISPAPAGAIDVWEANTTRVKSSAACSHSSSFVNLRTKMTSDNLGT
jgi:hypothetical protein